MNKIRFIAPTLFLLTALLYNGGCYFDNLQELHPELLLDNNCDTTSIMSYQTNISPILNNSCGANNNCHNTSGAGGGVILENYAGVKSSVASGKLISAILWDGNASQMPKGSPSKLNDCSMAKIQKWVDAGAQDN
jgi:hypothetical protein